MFFVLCILYFDQVANVDDEIIKIDNSQLEVGTGQTGPAQFVLIPV